MLVYSDGRVYTPRQGQGAAIEWWHVSKADGVPELLAGGLSDPGEQGVFVVGDVFALAAAAFPNSMDEALRSLRPVNLGSAPPGGFADEVRI